MAETSIRGAGLSEQVPAAERLTLQSEILGLTMWPRMGGKVVSLAARMRGEEHELLHAPIHDYREATATSGFESWDAGGWDECLPSIAVCETQGAAIPDHGDVWRRPWRAEEENGAIRAHVDASSLPLRFSRAVKLEGPAVQLEYTVVNTGERAVKFLWSAHPLFAVEEGDRVVLPPAVKTVMVESGTLPGWARGLPGVQWPVGAIGNGGEVDLSRIGARDGRTAYKLFAGPLDHGWCGLYRSQLRMGILVRFDAGLTPFAGLWICHGAWPESGEGKQYTVALEPATAGCDSLERAERLGQARELGPGETARWPMRIEVLGGGPGISYEEFVTKAATESGA